LNLTLFYKGKGIKMKYICTNLITTTISVAIGAYYSGGDFDFALFIILFTALGMCDVLNYIRTQELKEK